MAALLRRGLLAGLLAGLAGGVFLFLAGEPLVDRALRYEHVPAGHAHEVFSRWTQSHALILGVALYGVALGGVFAVVYGANRHRLGGRSAWERSLGLGLAGFGALWLVPFLKYPANPPGVQVGDPAHPHRASALYLAMVGLSLAAAVLAWAASRRLAARGVERPRRQAAVAVGYLAALAAVFVLLPPQQVRTTMPAPLLWDARMVTLAGQALVWALLATGFGALELRAELRDAAGDQAGRPAARRVGV